MLLIESGFAWEAAFQTWDTAPPGPYNEKNDYRKKRKIDSYLLKVDLHGKQHSKHGIPRHQDLTMKKMIIVKKEKFNLT